MLLRRLLLLLAVTAAGCRAPAPSFRVGYMICNSLTETRERFAPITAHLAEATGARFEPVYLDTGDVEGAFAEKELDFTHTNSLLYVVLRERYGLKLVAAEKRGTFGALTRGTIIVRKGSGITRVADLRGKRVVFGPQWAPFGFLAQYALFLDSGVNPERDLGYYAIPPGSWKHEKIIYSVLHGQFDAGAAPLIDLEEMAAEGKIAPDDFDILAQSELAPYCTFGASAAVPDEWVARVRDALLSLDATTTAEAEGERLKVLKRAQVTGFESLEDQDYDLLRQWARAARMPPYGEY